MERDAESGDCRVAKRHSVISMVSSWMAARTMNGVQAGSSSEDSLPTKIAAIPLVLDDDPMSINSDACEDLEEEIVRRRVRAARTLFHQPRGDNDTV